MSGEPGVDAVNPIEHERSIMQIEWLIRHASGGRLFDAGCGVGRIAAPLSAAGIDVIAMDSDERALAMCGQQAPNATCLHGDFMRPDVPEATVDVVCCLGNTFSLLHDIGDAITAMQAWRRLLRKGGIIVIDDIPQDLWPELTCGNWASGISEEGQELVWADDDAVFALRDQPRPGQAVPDASDRRMRLWTMGALELLGRAATIGAPQHLPEAALIMFPDATG